MKLSEADLYGLPRSVLEFSDLLHFDALERLLLLFGGEFG